MITPGDEARVLPRLDHAREVVHGRVDIDPRTDLMKALITS